MNPYQKDTYGYWFWEEGFDNPGAKAPFEEDESGRFIDDFGASAFLDGQSARMDYEFRGMI